VVLLLKKLRKAITWSLLDPASGIPNSSLFTLTTSGRLSSFTPELIENFSVKAIIGKGGMDDGCLAAFKKFGCVYFHAVGGAAALLSDRIKEVVSVNKLEFGIPEAIWEIKVKDFPVIVTMDTHGNSIHKDIFEKTKNIYEGLVKDSK